MRTILIKQMRDMEEGCHAPLKEKLSRYVGGNTGNRVFVEALKEQVDYDAVIDNDDCAVRLLKKGGPCQRNQNRASGDRSHR